MKAEHLAVVSKIVAELRLPSSRSRAAEAPRECPADPGNRVSPPVIGRVSGAFRRRLDSANMLRLSSLAADAGEIGPYWVAAASVAGSSHLHSAVTRQDSYSFCHIEAGPVVAVAVADGLGSYRQTSQVGAQLLTRLTAGYLAAVPPAQMLADPAGVVSMILNRASRVAIAASDAFDGQDPSLLATTLTLAWIPAHGTSNTAATSAIVVGRVGDCSAFGLRAASFTPVFDTCSDGPLNVVGAYLPMTDAWNSCETAVLKFNDMDALVLASDGVAEDIVGSPTVRDWLGRQWDAPNTIRQMTDSLGYRRQGSHDDRTALVVWLAPDGPWASDREEPRERP